MQWRIMVASATGALLSLGVVSALAARTPSEVDVAEMRASMELLRSRVSTLEAELERVRAARTAPMSIPTPFQVVDDEGKPVLIVTGDHHAVVFTGQGTVSLGPNSDGGSGIVIQGQGGVAVAVGGSKAGYGVVEVHSGGKRIASLSQMGLITWNPAGKEVAHLGADPTNKDRADLKVRGGFEILDANFNTIIDGGTLPDGRGAIRTWPNEECRTFAGLRPPTCLMGVKP